jgi:hypothetical protein
MERCLVIKISRRDGLQCKKIHIKLLELYGRLGSLTQRCDIGAYSSSWTGSIFKRYERMANLPISVFKLEFRVRRGMATILEGSILVSEMLRYFDIVVAD